MGPFSCLAIDMGAGSIRIVQGVFDGGLYLNEIHRFENHIENRDGADRWNLKEITEGIMAGIEKAVSGSQIPVKSIGVDSWGVDFVLLGDDGNPLEDPVSYRDNRTSGMKYMWNTMMTDIETFTNTGVNYNVFNTLYQLLSLKGTKLLDSANRILFMADYINYFLCGNPVNEITLSSTSQILSCKTNDWDKQIINLLGLNKNLLTKPVLPGTTLGNLNLDGFNRQLEIMAVAGHDTASAITAIPFENENFAFISTGTWCIVGMISDNPYLSSYAFKFGITNERTCDGRFRPLKNIMGLWLVQQLRVAFGSKHSYSQIDEMASKATISEMLINPDDPDFYNPTDMKKAFDGYLIKVHGKTLKTEADYYRCAYDSLANSFNEALTKMEFLRNKSFETIHIIGGGSQSKLLCQLTANATGKKVIAGPVEGAVIGNLITQAIETGYIKNLDDAKTLIYSSTKISNYKPNI